MLTMEGSVIQDTRFYGDRISAVGIWVEKAEANIKDSVVLRNAIIGVWFEASQGTVVGSVVSDTWDKDGNTAQFVESGIRIAAGSDVKLLDSLVARNRFAGILALDSTVQVERSIIRDTLPFRANKLYGFGVLVNSPNPDSTSKLTLKDSLVADNADIGVLFHGGGDALLEGVVVRGTANSPGKNTSAHAVYVAANRDKDDTVLHPSRARIQNSLLEGNKYMGLLAWSGADVTVQASTIRSTLRLTTLPEDEQGGVGVWVQENAKYFMQGYRANLKMSESLVEGSQGFGLTVMCGGRVVMERSLIRGNAPAKGNGASGALAVFSKVCDKTLEIPVLSLKESGVQGTSGTGIQVQDATASVDRCVVEDTKGPQGDGITVVQEIRKASLSLTRGYISKSKRAGILFSGGGGKVCTSIVRQGTFSIVLDKSASPTICEDVVLKDNNRNNLAFGQGLKPSPIPRFPKLTDPF